ncbi:RT0821/Lpp0805 family surface protein [Methylobacterium sp. Leaf108]|uniref:RT0821/Lpp0805 family surface protein n=1 Tax=Methylobacterium sp. Leaf108 TaxID=1736256 RepID=UPI0009E8C78A|nr:RT0821/Lpp0805 family surface protein [Methylobacterium sp. Leaf108]
MRVRNDRSKFHSPNPSPDPRRRPWRLVASVGIGLSVLPLVGCGLPLITFQTEEPATVADPVSTGSIDKQPRSFGGDLGTEDWRRAHAALTVALDPQGNGRPVKWDNPETRLRGAVNPTGLPYVAGDFVCRDFLASVIAPQKSRFVRGTGCKLSGGEWELRRLRAAKAGA